MNPPVPVSPDVFVSLRPTGTTDPERVTGRVPLTPSLRSVERSPRTLRRQFPGRVGVRTSVDIDVCDWGSLGARVHPDHIRTPPATPSHPRRRRRYAHCPTPTGEGNGTLEAGGGVGGTPGSSVSGPGTEPGPNRLPRDRPLTSVYLPSTPTPDRHRGLGMCRVETRTRRTHKTSDPTSTRS